MSRHLWVIVHRWAGLTMAFFLIVAGATGALLPFYETPTFASRPILSSATPPCPGATPFDGLALAERVQQQTGGLARRVPRSRSVTITADMACRSDPIFIGRTYAAVRITIRR